MANIFKELYRAIEKLESEKEFIFVGGEEYNLIERKLKALNSIKEYLLSYSWLSHGKYKERVSLFIKSGFDYRGCAEQLGVHLNTFETSMSYANKKFQEKIGKDTIKLIMDGQVARGLLQFNIGTGNLSLEKLIFSEVYSKFPDPKFDILMKLKDCEEELKFLRMVSIISVLNKMKNLDKDKLAFIRYILESTNSKYAEEREKIVSYLMGVSDKL